MIENHIRFYDNDRKYLFDTHFFSSHIPPRGLQSPTLKATALECIDRGTHPRVLLRETSTGGVIPSTLSLEDDCSNWSKGGQTSSRVNCGVLPPRAHHSLHFSLPSPSPRRHSRPITPSTPSVPSTALWTNAQIPSMPERLTWPTSCGTNSSLPIPSNLLKPVLTQYSTGQPFIKVVKRTLHCCNTPIKHFDALYSANVYIYFTFALYYLGYQ